MFGDCLFSVGFVLISNLASIFFVGRGGGAGARLGQTFSQQNTNLNIFD